MLDQSKIPSALQQDAYLLVPDKVMLPDGAHQGYAVAVAQGVFTAIGKAADMRQQYAHLPELALPHHLLMPGLIDAHTHLTQSLGKALAFGEPSEIFRRIWVPMEGVLRERAAYVSSKLAALEALRGGFTTVVDAGTRSSAGIDALANATREVGIRCVLAALCNDLHHPLGDKAFDVLRTDAIKHLQRFEHDRWVHASLAISIPEVASDRMLTEVARLALEAKVSFQTHANEHLVAVERSLVARGLRPIELLAATKSLNSSTLLAHATLMTPNELGLVKDSGAAIAYNPVASQWKGNAVLDALQINETGVPFALGTDGTRYDGFRLMDAAEASQRLTRGLALGDSSCGGGWIWFDHATHLGAKAIGLGGVTGSIEVGKAADFLLIDLDVPELVPSWDLAWELVRLADKSQIDAVAVNGELKLWKGWPISWDAKALMEEARTMAREDIVKAPIQRIHATADVARARSL